MKIRIYGFVAMAGIFLFGCAKFNLDQVKYEVKPSPLELHGDSVKWSVTASYPEKLVPKKADITITPVLKYQGGKKVFRPFNTKEKNPRATDRCWPIQVAKSNP